MSHQPPQIETDRRAGKLSFAVRFGSARTVFTARVLFAVFVSAIGAVVLATTSRGLVFALGLLALVLLFTLTTAAVNPKRILIAASLFVAAGLLATASVG